MLSTVIVENVAAPLIALARTVVFDDAGACTFTTLSGASLQSNDHVAPLACHPPCTVTPATGFTSSTYLPAET